MERSSAYLLPARWRCNLPRLEKFLDTLPSEHRLAFEFRDPKAGDLTIRGEILVEAQDGGVMLLGDDGRIWTIQPDQIVSRDSTLSRPQKPRLRRGSRLISADRRSS